MPRQLSALPYALGSVLCFSVGPVLVRLAQPFTPWQLASFRTLIGAALLGTYVKISGGSLSHSAIRPRLIIPMGLAIGGSYGFLFLAMQYGSIAHSLTFSYLSPVFTAVAMRAFFGEPVGRWQYAGMVFALVGIAVLTGFEPQVTLPVLLGDVMAALSGLCWSAYSALGRCTRGTAPLGPLALWIYLVAGISLAPVGLSQPVRVDSPHQLLALVLLGAVPLVGGQTLYLAAIQRMHPAVVNTISSLEVIGGSLMGWVVLGEKLGPNALLGAGMVQIGAVLVLARRPVLERGMGSQAHGFQSEERIGSPKGARQ